MSHPSHAGTKRMSQAWSRRDNSNVTPESRGDSLTKNQEPITNNQKNSSNEEFSLPPNPLASRGGPQRAPDEDYPIEFEQFWQTYPRKTGKRKAYTAWRKARRKTNNVYLLAKASLYAADRNREPATRSPRRTGWTANTGTMTRCRPNPSRPHAPRHRRGTVRRPTQGRRTRR